MMMMMMEHRRKFKCKTSIVTPETEGKCLSCLNCSASPFLLVILKCENQTDYLESSLSDAVT